MDVVGYLARIGLTASPPLDAAGLERLQRSHLTCVPFENLDVFYRRGVSTDPAHAVTKIVEGRRGGWCFELNGGFASLLEALGFAVTRLGAAVLLSDPAVGPHPDHAAIRVDLDHPYLVDVGFGDSFIRPLRLDADGPQDGGVGRYDFIRDRHMMILRHLKDDGVAAQYRFTLDPVTPADFNPASDFLQTSPTTDFTRKPFATRLLDGGPDRVTLVHDRLKIRKGGIWSERPVSASEWPAVLAEWFAMDP